jgi:hypothetical protein
MAAPVIDLGTVFRGGEYRAEFRLRNRGWRSVRVVGASSHCSATGCGHVTTALPIVIGPGQERRVKVLFDATFPGRISYHFRLFTDAHGQDAIELAIEGEVVDRPHCSDAGV